MTEQKAKVQEKKGRSQPPKTKVDIVSNLVSLMDKYPLVGIVDMQNLPAKQLTDMRAQLREKVELLMTKKRFIRLALNNCKKDNIINLNPHLKGMPAILLTKENPFTLYKILKKNRSNAPIKGGQTAPNDIVVPAGPTGFSPGPIIGELGTFKIKAGIDAGKVAIKEDAIVAKEGTVVSEKLASLLTRLGIEPMEIGLNLRAVYEKGDLLTKDVLDIDEEAYINNIVAMAKEAINLAVYAAYPAKEVIEILLGNASRDALGLAKEQGIITPDTVNDILAKADAQMNALKSELNI